MDKIIVNGKSIELKENTPLKEVLEREGLVFPCDGQKKCGKCRIICPELAPTPTDKRFLSQNQIEDGVRIACDKKSKNDIKIYFEKGNSQPARKLEYCNIIVDIDSQNITIGILEEELVEVVKVKNNIEKAKNPTYELRSEIAKNAIELFEKYSVAKADTFAVNANGYYIQLLTGEKIEEGGEVLDALEYMLPGESLYIMPFVDEISARILAPAINKEYPLIVLNCQKTFTAALFTEEENFIIEHKNVSYQKEELVAIRTTLDFLIKKIKRPPIINIYGDFNQAIEPIIDDLSYTIEERDVFEILSGFAFKNRMRNKLFKLANKSSLLKPEQSDEWQELFLSANNRYNSH